MRRLILLGVLSIALAPFVGCTPEDPVAAPVDDPAPAEVGSETTE